MPELSDAHAMAIERSCAVTAVALSGQRREGVRLVTGAHREFSVSSALDFVHVPYPSLGHDWTRRTLTCGVALQCSPSKERLAEYRLNELSTRELVALTLVEAGAATRLGRLDLAGTAARGATAAPRPRDAARRRRCRGDAQPRSRRWRAAGRRWRLHPLMGRLPLAYTMPQGLSDKLRRSFGRMPWTTTQKRVPRPYSVPVGGDGGVRNPNLPPPSRPQDNDLDVTPDHRPGHPVSGVERVDEELHAGPRRGPRAPAHQSYACSRRRHRPTSGNGSPSTPIAR